MSLIRTVTNTPANTLLDAFGRQRVSNPSLLLSSVFDFARGGGYELLALRWTNKITTISGSADGAVTPNVTTKASVTLTLNAYVGAGTRRVTNQTKQYFLYRAGQSQQIAETFVFGSTNVANANKRVGFFDDSDGWWLQRDGAGAMTFNARSSASGSVVDATPVTQANWNQDTFGAGALNPSGITLNFDNSQIMICDFQYLGVGIVRVGFSISGVIYWAHWFNTGSPPALTTVYAQSMSLPVRYEIHTTAATASPVSMEQICSKVACEGSEVESAVGWEVFSDSSQNSVNVNYNGAWAIILAVRLQATLNLRASLVNFTFGVFNTDNTNSGECVLALIRAQDTGALSGTITYSALRAGLSIAEIARAPAQTYNPSVAGVIMKHEFAPSAQRGGSGKEVQLDLNLPAVADFSGTQDQVILATRSYASTPAMRGSLGWFELY